MAKKCTEWVIVRPTHSQCDFENAHRMGASALICCKGASKNPIPMGVFNENKIYERPFTESFRAESSYDVSDAR